MQAPGKTVRDQNGQHMAGDDSPGLQVPQPPGRLRPGDDAGLHLHVRRAEKVPTQREGIGKRRQRILAADQQQGQVVGEVVGERDRHDRPYHEAGGAGEAAAAGEALTDPQVVEQIEIQAKYQGYIDRQREEVERQAATENTVLPEDIDYAEVAGLSNEVRQKLARLRPQTLGQAARIQGMTPAAISLLLIHLKRRQALPKGAL